MNHFYLTNSQVYASGRFIETAVTVGDGIIQALGAANKDKLPLIDGGGHFLIPGMIDPHTHGAVGIDCNQARLQDFERLSAFFASHGTTGWLCSLAADSVDRTMRALETAAAVIRKGLPGAELLGIHLEGPFLSPDYAGALEKEHLLLPDRDLLERYRKSAGGHLLSLTLAPELPGAQEMIEVCRSQGIRVSLGHSGASWQEARRALEAGASSATHLGNAMRPMHHREPGILGAALESDPYAELICDGHHLHPAFVRLVEGFKGPDRLMAVTDSIMAAGLGDGEFSMGQTPLRVEGGRALARPGVLAGSTLTMDGALRNLSEMLGKGLEQLVPYVSTNAARWLGLDHRKGLILPGMDADLILLDPSLSIQEVFCRGRACGRME